MNLNTFKASLLAIVFGAGLNSSAESAAATSHNVWDFDHHHNSHSHSTNHHHSSHWHEDHHEDQWWGHHHEERLGHTLRTAYEDAQRFRNLSLSEKVRFLNRIYRIIESRSPSFFRAGVVLTNLIIMSHERPRPFSSRYAPHKDSKLFSIGFESELESSEILRLMMRLMGLPRPSGQQSGRMIRQVERMINTFLRSGLEINSGLKGNFDVVIKDDQLHLRSGHQHQGTREAIDVLIKGFGDYAHRNMVKSLLGSIEQYGTSSQKSTIQRLLEVRR